MATKTDISTGTYIFKDNSTFLNQENWSDLFSMSLTEGFRDHFAKYDNSAGKFVIGPCEGIIKGLLASTSSGASFDPVSQSEVDCLFCLQYDGTDVKLIKVTNINISVNSAIDFLDQIMYRYSSSLDTLRTLLHGNAGVEEDILPIAYGIYGHGYWDLTRIIPPNGGSRVVNVSAYGTITIDTPYCGELYQDGLAQIYGNHDYRIGIDSDYSESEFRLYPVPAISTAPARLYIENKKSSAVTIKLPLSYRDMYFEYRTDNSWEEDSGFLAYDLAGGSSMILNVQQYVCNTYTSGGVHYPSVVYEISRGFENVDMTDVYSKAEANALFETQSDAATALAAKADASDVYTKTAADALLADKADASDTYTKAEVDALIEDIPVISTVYTKTETDDLLAGKADVSDVYSKAQANALLNGKADITAVYAKAQVYNKTETDALLADKADADDVYAKAETYDKDQVDYLLNEKADLNSPTFYGSPKAPTAAAGTSTTQIATTAFVQNALANKADVSSPTFTGEPKAPTPSADDSSTKIATTSYVKNVIAAAASVADLYVDWSRGNDSTGKGTSAAPFKTIQKAIDTVTMSDFVTIHIVPDVYQETLTINGKNIKLIGTTDTDIKITSLSTNSAAVTVDHGANVELVGIFSIYGQHHGLAVKNNSSVTYQYGFANDRFTVRAENAAQDVVHRAISVNYGGKFSANGEVDVYIYPNTQTSHGVEARYGGFVSITKLVADIYSNDTAVHNENSFAVVGELSGTYGTAYTNVDTACYTKIGNVN